MRTGYLVLAGIDVHKKMLAVVVRIESDGQVGYERRKFGTTQSEIRHLAAWLASYCQLPGVDVTAAQQWIAEIGPEAATFPSPQQLASWVGVCPGKRESAGVNVSSRSAKGNHYLRRLLCQIAWAATHAKGTFFAGLFRRWTTKLGAKAAA